MKRPLLLLTVLALVGGALAFSGNVAPLAFNFQKEERNPVSHFRFNLGPEDFQFVIVSDRTGGHRAQIFAQAAHRLNLLQPAFVMSVGDLIEGGKKTPDVLAAEWQEFDSFVSRLAMPFFYVPGNHDVAAPEAAKVWEEKLGRRYYHFLYRDVLFLILNSDDPAGSNGRIANEQIAFAQKVLADNAKVKWTLVFVHRPLWVTGPTKNGWAEIEKALEGRPYTVFAGHVHRYQKFVRQGMNYYQLATTGGSSKLRGQERGEFDHIVWITMKKDGPVLANIMLDALVPENLQFPTIKESGTSTAKRLPTYPVQGKIYFDGAPIPGAQVLFQSTKAKADGIVQGDGSFTLTTYRADDGLPEGEYTITVTWRQSDRQGKLGANLLPVRFGNTETSGLKAAIQQGPNEVILELKK